MSTDLTTSGPIPTQFVNPQTGEVVNTSDPDEMRLVAAQSPETIGLMLETIDAWIAEAQHARSYIGEFLIDRLDADATQTLHAGEYTLTVNGSSDEYETYDADKLDASLASMVADGIISEAAAEKTIRVKREVSKSGLNSLRALRRPEIEEAVAACTQIVAKRRRVTVKRVR